MSKRTDMLSSVIREVLSPVLHECLPLCGIVSITEVEVSADSAHATVYLSALQDPDAALAYMQKGQKGLQKQLYNALQRKKVPQLRFRMDERPERGERIDQLLREES